MLHPNAPKGALWEMYGFSDDPETTQVNGIFGPTTDLLKWWLSKGVIYNVGNKSFSIVAIETTIVHRVEFPFCYYGQQQ